MPYWFIKNRPSHRFRDLVGPRSPWELQWWLSSGRSVGCVGPSPAEALSSTGVTREGRDTRTQRDRPDWNRRREFQSSSVPPEAFLAQLPGQEQQFWHWLQNSLGVLGCHGLSSSCRRSCGTGTELKCLPGGHLVPARAAAAQLLKFTAFPFPQSFQRQNHHGQRFWQIQTQNLGL